MHRLRGISPVFSEQNSQLIVKLTQQADADSKQNPSPRFRSRDLTLRRHGERLIMLISARASQSVLTSHALSSAFWLVGTRVFRFVPTAVGRRVVSLIRVQRHGNEARSAGTLIPVDTGGGLPSQVFVPNRPPDGWEAGRYTRGKLPTFLCEPGWSYGRGFRFFESWSQNLKYSDTNRLLCTEKLGVMQGIPRTA